MESGNQKILTVSYMVLAALVGIVTSTLLEASSAVFGTVARLMATDFVRHGVPVLVGVAVFVALQFNKKANAWGNDVVTELKKVVWPSRKDTTAMTIVVSIMLLVSGVVIGMFDFFSAQLISILIE